MTKTRILYISRAWGKQGGGMERLSFDFITQAAKHPALNVTSIVHEVRPNESLLLTRVRAAVFALRVIPQALFAAKSFDVVHIGDPVLSLVGWLIRVVHKKPVIVTVHGLDVLYPNALYQLYLRMFFTRLSLYLPISAFVQDVLRDKGITLNVHVLTPGVYDRIFSDRYTTKDLAGVLNMSVEQVEKIRILFTAGRLVHRKGHAWFIANVLPRLPENTLYVIAGNGLAASDISDAIQTANQAGRVRMLGRVSDETLQILYNTVDMFVQPNVATPGDIEGFGLVLLEAALCNRLVLASNLEGMKDAISDGKNGYLLPSEDVDAWAHATQTAKPIEGARAFTLENFSWSKKIEAYSSLVTSLPTR